jgi:phage shock protein PspC (stress-responsive transcriptional regulator)
MSTKKSKNKIIDMKENKGSYEKEKIKKIYLSTEDKMIGGVCGGIAEYFNIDVIWARIGFLVALFTTGIAFLIYIIMWILVPENPHKKFNGSKKK